jgi:hypothetical protein
MEELKLGMLMQRELCVTLVHQETFQGYNLDLFFSLENAGELRFIILRRKTGQEPGTTHSTVLLIYIRA